MPTIFALALLLFCIPLIAKTARSRSLLLSGHVGEARHDGTSDLRYLAL